MASVGGGGEEVATVSPKSRVKFLCSHGGKIMPRPNDGQLKYVGGETRVVACPRDIGFSELMKKLAAIAEDEVVLKYQLIPEDMDVLVSVTCDEDLNHMLHEYDRHETQLSEGGSTPRLRTFLFPSHPPLLAKNQTTINHMANNVLEQRYIDALNVIRSPSFNIRSSISGINRPTISSAGSSPRSIIPEGSTIDGIIPHNYHRVSSSPSLSSLAKENHHGHQMQQHAHPHYPPPRLHCPYSNGCGHGRAAPPAVSLGRSDFGSRSHGHVPPRYFSPTRRLSGNWGCSFGPIDEGGCIYRSGEFEKEETKLHHSSMKQTWES
ncbi:uncharacterized protein LOC122081425 [Macadamia integrifolia]|uniref:uncharacterized protein LOC122081425 n=1 Tax=Macadamia integrifolia TaxID=60698 RepID=UPI001C4E93B8|nr:uncharacterized protein LOC122081425 [Macadamia integrifolia]XP_042504495.1 uncharacterized protein LOC122081425 [Macadamia integrifolia]XP_042504496.1 uncharacterized protein LOC122081425 [Macadamia integrifolia]XP_042504497.1 uncharacterized protein LOC122081425 [Macadamia integrifolia]XP_042504498.1 uncharacterized protein LOC122081425 [Macadamia integrifolia]